MVARIFPHIINRYRARPVFSRKYLPGQARLAFDREKVPRLRGRVGKDPSFRVEVMIGAGQTVPMLAQVFFPGGNDERLHKGMGFLSVAKEGPSTRARP